MSGPRGTLRQMAEATATTTIIIADTHGVSLCAGFCFQPFCGTISFHPRHSPMTGYCDSHFIDEETRHREVEHCDQDHTANQRRRWNVKQVWGLPEPVFPPAHQLRLLLPRAQRSQLSKLELLPRLLRIALPREARLSFLKHTPD